MHPHAPPKFLLVENTLHALLRASCAWQASVTILQSCHVLHVLNSSECHVNPSMSAAMLASHVIQWHQQTGPLTSSVDRWLFDQSQNFWTGPILISFLHKFQLWAQFLHLRSLNPTFRSFSSLWLNKMTEISYVLSPFCWMVLLAIMHGLRIWLSFSRVKNCGDKWLVQFLSQYQNLNPKSQLL